MIGALISVLSLNLTLSLVQAGQIAKTFPITAATTTTPIAVTSTAHGVPLGRVVHAVVSGLNGMPEATGLWVMTPTDANTFTLAAFTAQGVSVPSVGKGTYVSGGIAQVAFPDYQILLGRRWIAQSTAVVSPRIVVVPTDGKAWSLEPYGGAAVPGAFTPPLGNLEQQAEAQQPQLATSFPTFEVYVTGCANPPSPDFGDFDATQAIVDALFVVLFDAIGPARAQVLHDSWPSQLAPTDPRATGSLTQRGQQWKGILQLQHPVVRAPLSFVPAGVSLVETVTPLGAGSGDYTTITITAEA